MVDGENTEITKRPLSFLFDNPIFVVILRAITLMFFDALFLFQLESSDAAIYTFLLEVLG